MCLPFQILREWIREEGIGFLGTSWVGAKLITDFCGQSGGESPGFFTRTTTSCSQHRNPDWQSPTRVYDAAKPPRLQALPWFLVELPQPGWCHPNFDLVPRSQRQKNLCSLWLVKSDPQPDLLWNRSPTWNSRCLTFPQHHTANILTVLNSKGSMFGTLFGTAVVTQPVSVCLTTLPVQDGCDIHELAIKSRMVSTFT